MLPETPAKRALQMAERVRLRIAGHRFKGGVGADIFLTNDKSLRGKVVEGIQFIVGIETDLFA